MLVLFETPAGYAIFKLLKEKKLKECDNLFQDFATPEAANQILKLKHFKKFQDTTEALQAATATVEGKMSKPLKKMLKKLVVKETQDTLAVADAKLGNSIKEKMDINCVANSSIQELMRCIRSQMDSLITGLPQKELAAMSLGLAHSLSRYKLKFSPDKVDTMIVQAISLLDDLDKELNNYVMRAREWYGWHFPELGKIVTDNLAFAKVVKAMGHRTNHAVTDFGDILPEEIEQEVKEAAEISMGTEVSDEDILNIKYLCEQVIEITEYRAQLYDYLKNRMSAIAPNLTMLVGELVGARLISHAGSLLNLAKHPASTIQILGAEKALFRALKTKHDTPKYGLIYHASMVGQSNPKNKGKVARMLAAKAALVIRVDALDDDSNMELGIEQRAKLESRLRAMDQENLRRISGTGKAMAKWDKYENKSQVKVYNASADSTLPEVPKKRKFEGEGSGETPAKKKLKAEGGEAATAATEVETPKEKKKKKKRKMQDEDEDEAAADTSVADSTLDTSELAASGKKKKKKKKEVEEVGADTSALDSTLDTSTVDESGEKKKKKKKKKHKEDDD